MLRVFLFGSCSAAMSELSCWHPPFSFEICCGGPAGNPQCWQGAYSYEACCYPVIRDHCIQAWHNAGLVYSAQGASVFTSSAFPRLSGLPFAFWGVRNSHQRGNLNGCSFTGGEYFQVQVNFSLKPGVGYNDVKDQLPSTTRFEMCVPSDCPAIVLERDIVPRYVNRFLAVTELQLELSFVRIERAISLSWFNEWSWKRAEASCHSEILIVLLIVGVFSLIVRIVTCSRYSARSLRVRSTMPDALRVAATISIIACHLSIHHVKSSNTPGYELDAIDHITDVDKKKFHSVLAFQAEVFFLLSVHLLVSASSDFDKGGLVVAGRKLARKISRQVPLLTFINWVVSYTSRCLPVRKGSIVDVSFGKSIAQTSIYQRLLLWYFNGPWPFHDDLICWLVVATSVALPVRIRLPFHMVLASMTAYSCLYDGLSTQSMLGFRVPMTQITLFIMLFARRLCRNSSTWICTWRGWLLPLCLALFIATDIYAAVIHAEGQGISYELIARASFVVMGSILLQVSECANANGASPSPGSVAPFCAEMLRFLANLSFAALASHLLVYGLVQGLLDLPPLIAFAQPLVTILVLPSLAFWIYLIALPTYYLSQWPFEQVMRLIEKNISDKCWAVLFLSYMFLAIGAEQQ